jgi:pyruvate formate lyase activating enzyme
MPPLRCTPEHRLYATDDVAAAPRLLQAGRLTPEHYLVVPRRAIACGESIDAREHPMSRHSFPYLVPWKPSVGEPEVVGAAAGGATSRMSGPAPGTLTEGWRAASTSASSSGQSRKIAEDGPVHRGWFVTGDAYLVPVRGLAFEDFEGDVYNMEVAEEHNYVAGFFLVSNCQNWETSQALRDPEALAPPRPMTADEIVQQALRYGASTVASTYNEPLITSEWAVEVFKKAKQRGLKTAFISNGNGTPEVLQYLRPWLDLYKVDLKSFSDRNYRQLGGRLDRILDTIPRLVQMGFWVEIVTLIIPGFNDSDQELTDIARYLAGISPDIPWHVTAFHKDYRMTDPDNTPPSTLLRAHAIGRSQGLRYVYPGNLPGRVGSWEHTYCPNCNQAVIERYGFNVLRHRLVDGKCPKCATAIPGVWS